MPSNIIDKCPVCGKGNLRPRGYRKKQEMPIPKGDFRPENESTEFECDNCHHMVRVGGVHDYGKGVDSVKTQSPTAA